MSLVSTRRACGALALSLALPTTLAARPQQLVADINQEVGEEPASSPRGFVTVGAQSFFAAHKEGFGTELWVTDGTGAAMLADLWPGPSSSSPNGFFDLGGGIVLFSASTPGFGNELWRLDVASGTTALVADVWPGPQGSSFHGPVAYNGEAFFVSDDGVHGREVWRTDGTPAGTSLFVDLLPGPFGSYPSELTVSGPDLYFRAMAVLFDARLWRTDGTVPGLTTVAPDGSPSQLTDVGGTLFYSVDDGVHGEELWSTDGTAAGTGLVVDLATGGSSLPKWLTPIGNEVIFVAEADGVGGSLWRSDGTAGGTTLLLDLAPGTGADTNYSGLTPFGSQALFFYREEEGSVFQKKVNADVWITDGTAAGTTLLLDQDPTVDTAFPGPFVVAGGQAFFTNVDGPTGRELWRTDGVSVAPVVDLLAGPGSGVPHFAAGDTAAAFGSGVVFAAEAQLDNRELWFTDGTAPGTTLVDDLNPAPVSAPSNPRYFARLGDHLVFQADDGVHGAELWRSDGSDAGTVLVADLFPGAAGSDPGPFHAHGDRVFFTADDGVVGRELWVSDGTPAGTQLVDDLSATGGSNIQELASLGDRVVFLRSSSLWVTDGTAAGTVKLASDVGELEVLGDHVYFDNRDDAHGYEVFRSDGTVDGTELAFELVPGPWPHGPSQRPRGLTAVDGQLYYLATEVLQEWLLRRADPATGAVSTIGNQLVGSDDSIEDMTELAGELYFASDADPAVGRELYRTDGVNASLVVDLAAGPESGYLGNPAVVDGRLLFLGTSVPGTPFPVDLWSTDGTTATAVSPGVYDGLYGGGFATFDVPGTSDVALFAAVSVPDSGEGLEAWRTDGTAAGTAALFDLAPGAASSLPADFTRVGDTLFFTADTGLGRELYAVPFTASGGSAWETIGLGCPDAAGRFASIALEGTPALGSPVTVELANAAPNASALLVAGFAPTAADLGGCVLHTGLALAIAGFEQTDGAGAAANPLVIPSSPALVGLPVVLQWIVFDPGGAFLGVGGSSAGLELIASS